MNKEELVEILKKGEVCRIALNTDSAPYIVPLNYGFTWDDKLEIYFHCAQEGRKIDLIAKNNAAGFAIDVDHELHVGHKGCKCGMNYKSVIGSGKIFEVDDDSDKKRALDIIMFHYGYKGELEYEDNMFHITKILKLEVDEISGKQRQ